MAEAETKMVKVACRVRNGLDIRLFAPGYDDGTGSGYRPILPKGPTYHLAGPGGRSGGIHSRCAGEAVITEVPAEFATAWFDQNKENAFVAERMVFLVENDAEEK